MIRGSGVLAGKAIVVHFWHVVYISISYNTRVSFEWKVPTIHRHKMLASIVKYSK
jgi:hypothetical protein